MKADDMFRELGYEKADEYISGCVRYENREYGCAVTVMKQSVEFSNSAGESCFLVGKEEIRAVAKLLEEMEGRNGPWINAATEKPAEGEEVLVKATGKNWDSTWFEEAVLLAVYSADEGWILTDYPEASVTVSEWMPIPGEV